MNTPTGPEHRRRNCRVDGNGSVSHLYHNTFSAERDMLWFPTESTAQLSENLGTAKLTRWKQANFPLRIRFGQHSAPTLQ